MDIDKIKYNTPEIKRIAKYTHDIFVNGNGDKYIDVLSDPSLYYPFKCLSTENALHKLYNLHIINHEDDKHLKIVVGDFFEKLRQQNLDVYLSGSTIAWCFTHDAIYTPNDLDMYIPNISLEKIYKFELALKSLLPYDSLSICDKPLYLDFLIKNGDLKIQLIKINFNLMSEIFSTYHSGLLCNSFCLCNNNFVFMPQRLGSCFFTNLMSLGSSYITQKCIAKYIERYGDIIDTDINKHYIVDHDTPFTIASIKTKIFGITEDNISSLFVCINKINYGTKISISEKTSFLIDCLKNNHYEVCEIDEISFLDAKYMAYKYLNEFGIIQPTDFYLKYLNKTEKNIFLECVCCGCYLGNKNEIDACRDNITIFGHDFFWEIEQYNEHYTSKIAYYKCPDSLQSETKLDEFKITEPQIIMKKA